MNFLSWPMGFGEGGKALTPDHSGWKELVAAYGFTPAQLLTYREHPIDRIPTLIAHNIPVAMVYGDSDAVVPYIENGKILEDAYLRSGTPLYCVGKPGCDHHPHGLEDTSGILAFFKEQLQK